MTKRKPIGGNDQPEFKSLAGIRMLAEDYEVIRKAAAKESRTMTMFVRLAAIAKAREIVES